MFQIAHQISLGVKRLALVRARFAQVACLAFGRSQEEIENVMYTVFHCAEVGAVAPALADVERRLAEVACLRVELAQVGEMVDPALLGARADVEVHALDRAERADRVAAVLEDVVDGFGFHALFPALAGFARFAPAGCASQIILAVCHHRTGCYFAPAVDLFIGEGGTLRGVDERVDGARVVDLIVGDRRGIGGARTRVGENLPQQIVVRHTRNQDLGGAEVLIADQAGEIFPLWVCRIERRFGRVEGDVAGGAGRADEEGRFDRSVSEFAVLGVGSGRVLRQFAAIARPGAEVVVDLFPCHRVEARIGEFAEAERAGGRAEGEVTAVFAALLVTAGVAGRGAGVLEIACRVAVAGLADELQQRLVTGAPVEAVGFLVTLGRATVGPRLATAGVVDQPPGFEAGIARIAA